MKLDIHAAQLEQMHSSAITLDLTMSCDGGASEVEAQEYIQQPDAGLEDAPHSWHW